MLEPDKIIVRGGKMPGGGGPQDKKKYFPGFIGDFGDVVFSTEPGT